MQTIRIGDHRQVGAVQAVTTDHGVSANGAKSDGHNDTPPPNGWSHFEPSPSGQLRLSQPLIDRIEHGQHPEPSGTETSPAVDEPGEAGKDRRGVGGGPSTRQQVRTRQAVG
jgi:hypothetical protein